MSPKRPSLYALASGIAAGAVSSAVTAAYSATLGRTRFMVKQETLPLLPAGSDPIRILHLSDFHMTPEDKELQHFLSLLGDIHPDLVIDTGDNLAHPKAVPYVVQSLGTLLDVPGFSSSAPTTTLPPTSRTR